MPRTVEQAKMLDALLVKSRERVSSVLCLDVEDQVLEERITGRWVSAVSSATAVLIRVCAHVRAGV
jgi:adenylate kinase family enzyme